MVIEALSVENLREGIFCGGGRPREGEMYAQLEAWLEGNMLRGQIAREDDGVVSGFVLYYPIEHAPLDVTGEGLYMVQCVTVRPEFRGRGVGKALVESALSDARENGASGLAVEAFRGEKRGGSEYMPATFFGHMGLEPGVSRGSATLYYKRLLKEAPEPAYLDLRFSAPPERNVVRIDVFDCRRCYTKVHNRSVVEAVAESVGSGRVKLVVHNQNSREAVLDKGMSSGVFVDGKLTFFKGPISEEDVMNAIEVAESARERLIDR